MDNKARQHQPLYPLRFDPIYQYRLWGGRRLANMLSAPLPDGPVGEAWLLSDREDHPSLVADGPLKGQTIGQLMKQWPDQLLGNQAGRFLRFPLLLKFLDAREMLSVQVHPSDINTDLLPGGETGKTEAWIVLEVGTESRIYAGLKPGCTEENLRHALANKTIGNYLECFIPRPGDAVYIPAGTIHSLGGDLMVFEVQQNSDVTFRLYDWDHVDDRTGQLRPLQVDQAIACIDFSQGIIGPVNRMVKAEEPVQREQLILCEHFGLWRIRGESPFIVGTAGMPRVLVCIDGNGHVEHEGASYPIEKGDVMLLPVVVGACVLHPDCGMSVLEISLPEGT